MTFDGLEIDRDISPRGYTVIRHNREADRWLIVGEYRALWKAKAAFFDVHPDFHAAIVKLNRGHVVEYKLAGLS